MAVETSPKITFSENDTSGGSLRPKIPSQLTTGRNCVKPDGNMKFCFRYVSVGRKCEIQLLGESVVFRYLF